MDADLSWIVIVRISSMIHHGPANALSIGRAGKFGNDPAPRDHADAIRQGENLVEILADEQHAGAAIAGSDEALVDRRASAGIEAPARAMGDDDRRLAAELARDPALLG